MAKAAVAMDSEFAEAIGLMGICYARLGEYGAAEERHRRQEALVTLTLHHDEALRWREGNWRGDGRLTTEGQSALRRWLKEHNCPTGAEARAEKMVDWDAFRTKTRDVVEDP